ncbi:DnaK suppressor protein [Kineococcus xinjiangensis]|uniref:DnaK suppressor protein n=1 Tax=Kineococcus xinjiangensis TaxID=512762 RepID=A0A2S6IM26_9ACTN|nr:TraR/DksA family transcriptional regulator [Kineococcus xinjiangensis]PPK95226.1 DnaK suppressor protein [Kineococcus xinjiangensis]
MAHGVVQGATSVAEVPVRHSERPSARRRPAPRPPTRDTELAWTDAELREQRAALVEEVERLSVQLHRASLAFSALVASGGQGAGDDQVDHGAATSGREHEMTIANNERDLLEQTERALERLDNGTYGVCESCGNAVGKARLQAFPRATLCIGCKSRSERR